VLLLTVAPPWAELATGQGQPLDAAQRARDDALAGAGQSAQLVEGAAPDPQDPGTGGVDAASARATRDALRDADEAASRGPIATLLWEGFEGPASLAERGWSVEALRGDDPWGIADRANGTVRRSGGASFAPRGDTGDLVLPVREGRHAATVMNAAGLYDAQVDARLVSPVVDLRYVLGASARTDDAYDLATKDPALSAPYKAFLQFWDSTLAPLRAAPTTPPLGSFTYLLLTPPSRLHRLALPLPDLTLPLPGGPAGPQDLADSLFVNPLASRYGGALVNLTFYHRYDLNAARDQEVPTANTDGAFLEARVVRPDGRPGPWEHLDGDAVFEAQVDKGTHQAGGVEYPCVPLVSAVGEAQPCRLSDDRLPLSGLAEVALGTLSGEQDYDTRSSFYQGRVKVHGVLGCTRGAQARQTVDCQTDVPAFVDHASLGNAAGTRMVKSHFTLNRFAGQQVQLAWRLHSGLGARGPGDLGWSLDAVKLEALVPMRDPGVLRVVQPRGDDVVPTTAVLQPKVVVKNYGYLPAEGVRVSFTVEDRGLEPAGQEPLPGHARLQASVMLPRLGPQQAVEVASPRACPACGPGAYRLRVELSMSTLDGANGTLPAERAQDGTTLNDNVSVPFEVRDVAGAQLRLAHEAGSAVSDLDAPKLLDADLTNTGNRELTGALEVTAVQVDPASFAPLPAARPLPVALRALAPGELPAGRRLSAFGADHDTLHLRLAWETRGLAPGVYRVTASLHAQPEVRPFPAATLHSFLRTTPAPYLAEDFEVRPSRPVGDGFGRDQLPYAGFASAGWDVLTAPVPLPRGAVSTNHTWESDARDSPLLDYSALSYLGDVPIAQVTPSAHLRVGSARVTALLDTHDPLAGVRVIVTLPSVEASLGPDVTVAGPVALVTPPVSVSVPAQVFEVAAPPAGHDAGEDVLVTAPATARSAPLELHGGPLSLAMPAATVRVPPLALRLPRGALGALPSALAWPLPATLAVPAVEVQLPPMTLRAALPGQEPFELLAPPLTLAGEPAEQPLQLPGPALALPPPSVGTSPFTFDLPAAQAAAAVLIGDASVSVCNARYSVVPEGCRTVLYPTDDDLASQLQVLFAHAWLDDYYLSTKVDLRACTAGCRPVVSFYHAGNFSWQGTLDRVDVPGAGPVEPPPAARAATLDEAQENRSRGLVEVTLLDGALPPAPALLEPGSAPAPCDAAPLACRTAQGLCAPDQALPPGARGLLPDPVVPTLGEAGRAAPCVARAAAEPLASAQAVLEFRRPVPPFRREEVDLSAYQGHLVRLAFHHQTTLGRLQSQPRSNQARLCLVDLENQNPPEEDLLCLGRPLDRWVVDNVHLADLGSGTAVPLPGGEGFFDSAGDPVDARGGAADNENWTRWADYRTMRSLVDANVALDPSCLPAGWTPGPGGVVRLPSTGCATQSGFRGPVVGFDGQGWVRTLYAEPQSNGITSPYPSGWFLDDTRGYQPPDRPVPGRTRALRWGGVGDGATYPERDLYAIAASPLLDLRASFHPSARFRANYSFAREVLDTLAPDGGGVRDGGAVFLARYAPDGGGGYALERRALAPAVGGYPSFINDTIQGQMALPWRSSDPFHPDAPGQPNGFGATSGHGPEQDWELDEVDLLDALQDLCVKLVEAPGQSAEARSFSPAECAALAQDPDIAWQGQDGLDRAAGTSYRNVTGFAEDPDGRYSVEFHAENRHLPDQATESAGWVLDDLRVGERFLANDLGVSAFEQPPPGRPVGPGEEVQVRVMVTNHGLFPQRGLRVHLNITQQGHQVFPPPEEGGSVVQAVPPWVVVPGLLGASPQRNLSVSFERTWTPAAQGLFAVNAWTEAVGQEAAGGVFQMPDEDASNDRLARQLEVRAALAVRMLGAAEAPDEALVQPLVGTAEQPRHILAVIENTGTVSEGLSAGRPLTVALAIEDESGAVVRAAEVQVDRVQPGRRVAADFGARAWEPSRPGLYTLRLRAALEGDRTPGDDERVLRVLVLRQLVPAPGARWQDAFEPGPGWTNASRPTMAAGEGWSFGSGDRYAPLTSSSLALSAPADLTNARNAVLVVRHRYDFERGYDGGLVEVSDDGQRWQSVPPLRGYPEQLTTASPAVAQPGDEVRAFSGDSGGVVEDVFPLGAADLARSPPVTLAHEDFDGGAGAVAAGLPAWQEVRAGSAPPGGQAWWVNKSVVWPASMAGNPLGDASTLEGSKVLRTARPLVVPDVNGSLAVEFSEWRSLGLGSRGRATLAAGYRNVTGTEVYLERLASPAPGARATGTVLLSRSRGTADQPYDDNQMDWTRRTLLLPGPTFDSLKGKAVRLAFQLHVANSNSEAWPRLGGENAAFGTGGPEDTDNVSPFLGWAVAGPRVFLFTTSDECDRADAQLRRSAGRAAFDLETGRCALFEDDLAYDATEAALGTWEGAWQTELYRPNQSPLVNASQDAGRALGEAGWRLVSRVGALGEQPVWDVRSPAPPRAMRGSVALAQGSGVDARLVAPLDLRAVASGALLRMDHAFKFTSLVDKTSEGLVAGGYAGGRVEVSRDGGATWEPLAPAVDPGRDRLAYTRNLAAAGFQRTFVRGTLNAGVALERDGPVCERPTHLACIDPADPFRAPAGWNATVEGSSFEPFLARATQTPFAGRDRDPEADSPLGLASLAFAGTTCARAGPEGLKDDPCSGPEDWRPVSFDLSPYAGQEVLLALHAWFPTHRFVGQDHLACAVLCGDLFVPRDFWRVDNLTLEARVLDGKPLLVRLRAFSDADGDRYGWDVLNVTLLADPHMENLGVRILHPLPGEPLLGGRAPIEAVVRNQGQGRLTASGLLLVEQAGAPQLQNRGFNAWRSVAPATGAGVPDGWTLRNASAAPAAFRNLSAVEGEAAVRLVGDGSLASPFTLAQELAVPPGDWVLRGRVNASLLAGAPQALVRDPATGDVLGSAALPGTSGLWGTFEVPFEVAFAPRALSVAFEGQPGEAGFRGTLLLDDLALEARVPEEAQPGMAPLEDGGFEHGLQAWRREAGLALVAGPSTDVPGLPCACPGPARAVPEGRQQLALGGLGSRAGETVVAQDLALEPGAYRLTGLAGSRNVTASLARGESAQGVRIPAPEEGPLQQTLQAADLPRQVRALRLWCRGTGCAGAVNAQLALPDGGVLGTFQGTAAAGMFLLCASACTAGAAPVSVPAEAGELTLSLASALGPEVQVGPDAAYPGGTLRGLAADLRLDAVGEVRADGTATLSLAGGPRSGRADAAPRPGGAVPPPLALPATAAPRLWQAFPAGRLASPHVVSATVKADAGAEPVLLHARLLGSDGAPLSDEGTAWLAAGARGALVTIPFGRALVPRDAGGLLALRAEGGEAVLYAAPSPDGGLRDAVGPVTLPDPADATGHRRLAASLLLDLAAARDGEVVVEAEGAEGAPWRWAGSLEGGPSLGPGRAGLLPFTYDFTVPQGRHAVTLRARLDRFQGEALLDGLRLAPRSQRAVEFHADLEPSQAAAVRDAGQAPVALTVPGATYRVRVAAQPLGEDAAVLPELVPADDRAEALSGPALGPVRLTLASLAAEPNSVNLSRGEPVRLRIAVRNDGAAEALLGDVRASVRNLAGQELFAATESDFDPAPERLEMAPLEERSFQWTFTPEATTPAGMYTFEATVLTPLGADVPPARSTRQSLLYLGTDFHRQFGYEWTVANSSRVDDNEKMVIADQAVPLWRWSTGAFHNIAYPHGNPCQPDVRNQPINCMGGSEGANVSGLGWKFVKTARVNNTAWRSFALCQLPTDEMGRTATSAAAPGGGDEGGAGTNACFWPLNEFFALKEGTIFVGFHSPAVDIRQHQHPLLTYYDRHDFTTSDPQGSVYARLVRCVPLGSDPCAPEASETFPVGSCEVLDPDVYTQRWMPLAGEDAITTPGFQAHSWAMRTVDLEPLLARAARERPDVPREAWDRVQVCWHLEQRSPAAGATVLREWDLDDVLVTPYAFEVGPRQVVPIGDNVTKDVRLAIRNTGAYTDTYHVALLDEKGFQSQGPANWRLELRDERGSPLGALRVEPGAAGAFRVRVHVAVAAPFLQHEGTVEVPLTVVSDAAPLLRTTERLPFTFAYPSRPNLRVAGLVVGDPGLGVDKPRTLDVVLQNTGDVPAPGVRVEVLDKMDPAAGQAPLALALMDGRAPPPLDVAPGDLRFLSFAWTPRVAGEHNLTVLLDPDNTLLEFDERDNVLVRPVLVPAATFPDLAVEASAQPANPAPGDLVDVQVLVRNRGTAAAEGVQVTVRAGVTDLLPGDAPHILPLAIPPGGSVPLRTTFRPAFPGEVLLLARAVTRAGQLERLETFGDNAFIAPVRVRGLSLDLRLPEGLSAQPGTTVRVPLTVGNREGLDDAYDLQLTPPDGWGARFPGHGERTALPLAGLASAQLAIELSVPRDAEAGPHALLLRATSQNTSRSVEAGLAVEVPARFGLRLEAEPVALSPGGGAVPLWVRNAGNAPDMVTLAATQLPAGWSAAPATLAVPPRSAADARLALALPTTTPAGTYRVRLQAQGAGGAGAEAEALVDVLPAERLGLRLLGLPALPAPGEASAALVRVANEGNLPAFARLRVDAPPGWRARLGREVVSMLPGEARDVPLSLVVPPEAPAGEGVLRVTAASGRDAVYDAARPMRAATAQLALEGLELVPRVAVRVGDVVHAQVRVANRGEVAVPASVAAYVDDQLLGFEDLGLLAPGREVLASLAFTARAGEHVVLASVDPGGAVGEADEADNARLEVLRVPQGFAFATVPGPELLLLASALLAAARRRR
jgi:hypothetical protein